MAIPTFSKLGMSQVWLPSFCRCQLNGGSAAILSLPVNRALEAALRNHGNPQSLVSGLIYQPLYATQSHFVSKLGRMQHGPFEETRSIRLRKGLLADTS